MASKFVGVEGGVLVVDTSIAGRQPVFGGTKSVRHTKVKIQKFLEPLKVTTREGAKLFMIAKGTTRCNKSKPPTYAWPTRGA